MLQSISHILNTAGELDKKSDQINYLQVRKSPALVTVCKYANPDVQWLLPEGEPPYEKSKFDEPNMFYQEARRLYIFVEGGPNLTQKRREQLFVEMLEVIDAPDAELLCNIKDGKLPGTLTFATLKRAFPELKT